MLHDSQTDLVFIPMAFRYHFPRFFKSLIAAFRAANVKYCELPYTSKKSRLWVRDYMPITVDGKGDIAQFRYAPDYLRAPRYEKYKPDMVPIWDDMEMTPFRYEDIILDGIASASKIRELIVNGEPYKSLTPMEITDPCQLKSIESAILYRLKTITPEELRYIADVSEGIEYRICEAAKQYNSLTEIYNAVKTKRYTMARIRRIVLSAFLGITAEMQSTPVPYLRILGIRKGLEDLLRGAKLPLIVKVKADYENLDHISEKEIFSADLRAAEAMNIARKGAPINEYSYGVLKE